MNTLMFSLFARETNEVKEQGKKSYLMNIFRTAMDKRVTPKSA